MSGMHVAQCCVPDAVCLSSHYDGTGLLLLQTSADKEAEYVEQRALLNTEVARLQRDLSSLQKSSTEEERHLRLLAQEAQAAADRAENK